MTPDDFMARAVAIAATAKNEPGALPYGAVVVIDGEIVGEGLNRAAAIHDPTSHGEVEAIRDACERLGTTDLGGAEMYTTAEPCAMCAALMLMSGFKKLYYAYEAAQGKAFIAPLAAKDPSLSRRFSTDELRVATGQPTDSRPSIPAERLGVEAADAVFKDFAKAFLAK
ncbi:MAG: nucleoside deaminase [Alphaproteobacteria bacterium]